MLSALDAPQPGEDGDVDIALDIVLLLNSTIVENLLETSISRYISDEAKQFFMKNAVNLVKTKKGVTRCVPSCSKRTRYRASSSSIPANYHVVEAIRNFSRRKNGIFIDEFNTEIAGTVVKFFFNG